MDHIAYCESKANELERLLAGTKSMLIRGAAGRKLPHGRVAEGETVYLLDNDGSGTIRAKGVVRFAFHSGKLDPDENRQLIAAHMDRLQLTESQRKRWESKQYLCLVDLAGIREIEPFSYVRERNMDDWIIVGQIQDIAR